MPTMYVTYAYIDRNTAWWDVDFYISRRYKSEQLWQYIKRVVQRARKGKVRLLEFTVFDGEQEVWRGTF